MRHSGQRSCHGPRRRAAGPALARRAALALVATVGTLGATPASAGTVVSRAPVVAFQAAGDVGGGVLDPGTTYPPTSHGFATLLRDTDSVKVDIETSNLPAGAYTVWWLVFDTPGGCSDNSCGVDDVFNADATVSIFRATGAVVSTNGVARFRARHRVDDDLGEPGTQHLLGDGSLHPSSAEIHNVIKYHGPASDDPETLHAQLTTVTGGCKVGANAVDLGPPFGVQCFDPQAVVHRP